MIVNIEATQEFEERVANCLKLLKNEVPENTTFALAKNMNYAGCYLGDNMIALCEDIFENLEEKQYYLNLLHVILHEIWHLKNGEGEEEAEEYAKKKVMGLIKWKNFMGQTLK